MLLFCANLGDRRLGRGVRSAGVGLQADIYSGNLHRLILENGYQTRLKLSKFSSDRAVVGVDDDSSKSHIGNAGLASERRHCLEEALKL